MKAVVVYYSLEGNTKKLAEQLAKHLKAETLELKPTKEVNSEKRSKYLWGGRQVMMKTKPTLQPYEFDCKNYDLIALGTPVWAMTYSPPLRTFLSEQTIRNKKILLFCTHEGGAGRTLKKLKESLNDNNTILSSSDFNRADSAYQTNIQEWLNNIVLE